MHIHVCICVAASMRYRISDKRYVEYARPAARARLHVWLTRQARARACGGLVEQRGDVIGGRDLGEAARGRQRGVAVAGGDVENALVAAEIDRFAKRFTDDLQRRADYRIVAGTPGKLLPAFDRTEVDSRGGDRLNVHDSGPSLRSIDSIDR